MILASASPRRRELLERVGIPLTIETSDVEETTLQGDEAPSRVAVRNALIKAQDIARRMPSDSLVLGADTIVVVDGQVLGKPGSPEEGASMLRRLSGRTHQVMTGFALIIAPGSDEWLERHVVTDVEFKTLSEREIAGYVATGEPFDKAGGYGIQGIGAFLVRRIHGSYTNVVGLPLTEVLEAIERLGGPVAFG